MSAPAKPRRLLAWRLFRKAEKYLSRGASAKAAALYGQAIAADPQDRGAWLWRGVSLAACGKHDEARRQVEQAIALDPRAAIGQFFLARVAYDAGRIEDARGILAGYLACEENQQAQGLLAACLLRADAAEQARSILNQGVPFAPWLLGRLLAAIEERAPVESPNPPPIESDTPAVSRRGGARQLRRGLVHLRGERWAEALNAFRAASAGLPEDPRVAYGLGVSLYYLEHFEEARRRLEPVIKRLDEPFRSDALATLGKAALELGEAQQAVLPLRRAIASGAATPENHYALGLALLRTGRPALARRAFEHCATPEFIEQRLADISSGFKQPSIP